MEKLPRQWRPCDRCKGVRRAAVSSAGLNTITLLQQDAPMSAKFASTAFLLFAAAPLAAQSSSPAYIVTRLGVDTVAVERYRK